jgi:hypothetical protein
MCMKRAAFLRERRPMLRKWADSIRADFTGCGGIVAFMKAVKDEASRWNDRDLELCGDCPACLELQAAAEGRARRTERVRDEVEALGRHEAARRESVHLFRASTRRDDNLADWFRRHPILP